MTNFDVGIRNEVKDDQPQRWFLITATASLSGQTEQIKKKVSYVSAFLQILDTIYWKYILIISIFLNIFIYITYFWFSPYRPITTVIVLMHLTCFLYWIDFLGEIIKTHRKSRIIKQRSLVLVPLILDAISLIPLSTLYVIAVKKINVVVLWQMRDITLIRFYRIPLFFSRLSPCSRKNWIISVFSYVCYLTIFIVSLSNVFLYYVNGYSPIRIDNWNATTTNKIITSLYYSVQVVFNVGYGDITPVWPSQMVLCLAGMSFGAAVTTGIFPGIIGSAFMNLTARRENYRYEYEAVKRTLKSRKLGNAATNNILDNMNLIWKYKKGYRGFPSVHILPESIKREIFFDINFGLLNRSLIFSLQPRYFLRSVAMFMKNITHLPGDIVLEPGVSDAMICVVSGVIEVLSEENDETVLLSLTSGTIIGEASLFFPLVRLCTIRASTYVELQVLMKVDLTRLALSYPEIFRSMRENIMNRFRIKDELPSTSEDEPPILRKRRKRLETKQYLENLKQINRIRLRGREGKADITSLYILSENIPRVKTYSLTLIKARPWILRPDTSLTKLWEAVVAVAVVFVSIAYPVWASFHRKIEPPVYVLIVITRAIYIIDIYIECTTAIEKKDNYTFIVTVKEIIIYKLKTVSFYFDVLSTYQLTAFASIIWPRQPDYGTLLLSLNALLKTWRVYEYMKKQENDIRNNLLAVVTVKYVLWIAIILTWGASLLYLEVRPEDSYIEDRWFYALEITQVQNQEAHPITEAPEIVTFYYASVTIFLVGYGDIVSASVPDCVVAIICMISGIILVILWVVETSTAQKHLTKIKTNYQEEVFAINKFMKEHEISKDLQKKVNTYMQLQWNFNKGYSQKKISPDDVLFTIQRQILITETANTFQSVPLFRGTSENFLKLLAKLSRIRVLPPNELISVNGELVRSMYILESGYCRVTGPDLDTNGVICAINSFGYIEMILGEPQRLRVETLTHVRIISLNYASYLMAITKFPGAKFEIDEALRQLDKGDLYRNCLGFKPFREKTSILPPENIHNKACINVFNYHKARQTSYSEGFDSWGKLKFLKYTLFPHTIHPNSLFLKIWVIGRTISTLIIGFAAPIQFSIFEPGEGFEHVILIQRVYTAIDMYLMFHVAYYNHKGILVIHPAKTALNYLKGNFVLDLISVIPYYELHEWIIPKQQTDPVLGRFLGMVIIIQLYKFFQGCYYLEQDILRKTQVIKVLKLLPLLLVVINVASGLIILIQCQVLVRKNESGLVGSHRLANELTETTRKFCLQKNSGNLTMDYNEIYKMYLTTVYWVTTTITVCGFGDIVPHNKSLMVFVILMLILGIFFFTLMFANITSCMVNTNVLITAYQRRMIRMMTFMKGKNVHNDLQKRLRIHYEYNWIRKEGPNPQGILYLLHANLRDAIVSSMYEDTIKQNPVLDGYEKYVVTVFSKHCDEIYFLQGETIIKYKDIQKYIYLIYRGKVSVITVKNKQIHSIGRGAMFGNISNEAFSLSPETVVAAENVDLLRIEGKKFFLHLQDLPGAADLINTLTSKTKNFIREKTTEDSSVTKLEKLNKYRIPPTAYQRVGSIHLDGNPYVFRGAIVYVLRHLYGTFVILPDTGLRYGIDAFFAAMSYFSYCLTMYMFAFQDTQYHILIAIYLLDVIFIVRIYLHFHMSYSDKFGDCTMNIQMIRQWYKKSSLIIYDALSNTPLEILLFIGPRDWWFKLLTILRLNRTLRLYYLINFFQQRQKKLMAHRVALQLCWTVIAISLLIHTLACIWFFAVCPVGFYLPNTWLTDMNLIGIPYWEYYIYSAYHVIVSTTTAGLQVLQVYSSQEIALSTLIMIMCRYAVVLLTSLAVTVINANSIHLYKFQEKYVELETTFTRQNVSEYPLNKMRYYLNTLWNLEGGKLLPKFIVIAPYSMKCDIMFAMFGKHLSHSYIFSKTDSAFIRQLAVHLKRYVYFPGNYIVQQGDIDYTMYFINNGQVSVLTIHPELMETIHYRLETNDSFGIKQGLIIGKAHMFSYRAETRVEILLLTYKDWQHLLKYFPDDAKIINARLKSLPE